MRNVLAKLKAVMAIEDLDDETAGMVERIVILRVSTKHIILWLLQLEIKRNEMCELAGLLKFKDVKKEVECERDLERWARRCTTSTRRR